MAHANHYSLQKNCPFMLTPINLAWNGYNNERPYLLVLFSMTLPEKFCFQSLKNWWSDQERLCLNYYHQPVKDKKVNINKKIKVLFLIHYFVAQFVTNLKNKSFSKKKRKACKKCSFLYILSTLEMSFHLKLLIITIHIEPPFSYL